MGHFIYDPLFIPPSLQISASDGIMRILQRLIEILDDKARADETKRTQGVIAADCK